eukprot:6214620-Pleurochrysis_carterae.AAC.3
MNCSDLRLVARQGEVTALKYKGLYSPKCCGRLEHIANLAVQEHVYTVLFGESLVGVQPVLTL